MRGSFRAGACAALGAAWIAAAAVACRADAPEAADAGAFASRAAAAAESADLVVLGEVTAKRNHRPTDGGFGYDIAVRETLKGPHAPGRTVRAGGWAYTVDLPIGTEVLLFLDETTAFLPSENFAPARGRDGEPLAFPIRDGRLAPAAAPANSGWKGRSIDETRRAIRPVPVE